MEQHYFSILGLALDIVGAFFVSVEAIKIKNLIALRDQVLRRAQDFTASPQIIFADDSDESPIQRPLSNYYCCLFIGLHHIAGLGFLIAADSLLGGLLYRSLLKACVWTTDQAWYVAVPIGIGFVALGVGVGLWVLGELVHVALTAALRASIRVVDFVEGRTPDGTVGIIGFLLLFSGFLLQMIGAYPR